MPLTRDHQLIRHILEADRPWAAYALADLDSRYFPFTTWLYSRDESALVLLYNAFTRPIVLACGAPSGLECLLDELHAALAGTVEFYVVARPELFPLLQKRCHMKARRRMSRMLLDARRFEPMPVAAARLGPGDIEAVETLYRDEPTDFFSPDMLKDGIYYGIYEGDALRAVAGTHILAPDYGVAALGNVYVHSAHRRRGYGTQVTSAVTRELLQIAISTIVLNVRLENHAAISIYERLGYSKCCEYFEAVAGELVRFP